VVTLDQHLAMLRQKALEKEVVDKIRVHNAKEKE
jgi:hypothetical protein